jgi:hypothetical protein
MSKDKDKQDHPLAKVVEQIFTCNIELHREEGLS